VPPCGGCRQRNREFAGPVLVSHWAVDSNATVKLITAAMRETGRGKKIGRAEALRRVMLTLIDSGNAQEAHPPLGRPSSSSAREAASRALRSPVGRRVRELRGPNLAAAEDH
jgi:hypothetical protein